MKPDCNILNPLQRDGLSQDKRLIKALHPSYVAIDEKDISDLLLYAKEYAQLIQYYSLENNPSGDWRKFIESDITTLVATIEKFDSKILKKDFENAVNNENYQIQFEKIFEVIRISFDWFNNSIPALKLHAALERVINSILNNAIVTSVAYAKRIEAIDNAALSLANLELGFSSIDIGTIQEDTSLFPNNDLTLSDDKLLAQRKIKKVFDLAYESVLSIVFQAPDFLEETLEEYHRHNPHMALFLAFLKLFKISQNHLNTITKRHLDFYYQEVLQLNLKPEQPDEVHLVFQLAKNFQAELIEKDTLLKAGKDDFGANVFFGLDNDIVINKTQLYEDGLKTIFLNKSYQPEGISANLLTNETPYNIYNLYAAPKANTLDGIEEELEENDKWKTFGDATMPHARIGFAISSPIFLLKEGQRIINIVFHTEIEEDTDFDFQNGNQNTHPIAHELMHNIAVQYSAEEEWGTCQTTKVELHKINATNLKVEFQLYIPPENPSFIGFNKEVLTPSLDTTFPTLYFLINGKGLASEFSCIGATPLVNENEVEDKIPDFIQFQILEFLNAPKTQNDWAEIAGVEPEVGPVIDNPLVGTALGNEATGYDIGETTARNIINNRNNNLGGKFENLTQVIQVPGVGVDKMNDLFYTFCKQNQFATSAIKDRQVQFEFGVNYSKYDMVFFNGQNFYATQDIIDVEPRIDSTLWQLIPSSNPYRYLQALLIKKIDLSVSVTGMQNLILENDVGTINPAKPFLPFGPQPKVGSKFYIGSHEIFQKKLVSGNGINGIDINIDWGDLPEKGFHPYYFNYIPSTAIPSNDNHFKAGVQYLIDRHWTNGSPSGHPLFKTNSNSAKNSPTPNSPLVQSNLFSEREIGLPNFDNYSNELRRGFIRLELKNHFLHKNYPSSLTTYIASPAGKGDAPIEPYTPIFNSISINYHSAETIDFSATTFKDSVESFFHITPFGWQNFYPNEDNLLPSEAVFSKKLVPEFKVTEQLDNENTAQTDAEGTLYVGLENLEPEQNVSILFQMAEGSADPDFPKQEVVWSYLSQNHWIDFDRTQILADSTNGLLTSGIVTLTMPKKMTNDNTILENGIYWIKVSTARLTMAISQTVAVMPQAVKGSFRKTVSNDLSRLSTPLPAEIISKLKERKAIVKSVTLPFSSFNGKLIEQNVTPPGIVGEDQFDKQYNEFYIRISERLRHKNRAITIDDYERIVLQQFPDIYKVKCINHTRILGVDKNDMEIPSSEHAPGFVKLIVVPSLRNRNAVNPLQPRVSSNRLDEIKNHLLPLKSDFVTLEVQNPLFEEVAVDFKVRFLPGFDKGFYEKKLKEDIVRFLSPWLYDEGGDLALGGKIHRSVILNFVEETAYVDYVTDFKLNHFIPGQTDRIDVEEAVTATSSSVIVSVPAIKHLIDPNTLEAC